MLLNVILNVIPTNAVRRNPYEDDLDIPNQGMMGCAHRDFSQKPLEMTLRDMASMGLSDGNVGCPH
jgi:hypothetical protein